MVKSDFTYNLITLENGQLFLSIIDLDLGRMSVTNDIENVLLFIRGARSLSVDQMRDVYIVYCDSDDQWDRVVYHNDEQVDFDVINMETVAAYNPILYKALENTIKQ